MSQYPQYQQQTLPPSNLPQSGGGYVPQQADSLGSWIFTTFVMLIPIVNFLYLLVLAFGGSTSIAKKNFARASLIWMIVGVVLSILGFILLAMTGVSLFDELSNSYSQNYDY